MGQSSTLIGRGARQLPTFESRKDVLILNRNFTTIFISWTAFLTGLLKFKFKEEPMLYKRNSCTTPCQFY